MEKLIEINIKMNDLSLIFRGKSFVLVIHLYGTVEPL